VIDKRVLERVQRLLELPALIVPLERQRTALRAERRTTEAKVVRQRVLVLNELMDGDERYKSASNQKERDLLMEARCTVTTSGASWWSASTSSRRPSSASRRT